MARTSKVEKWEEALWKEIRNTLFNKHNPQTEMDKVRLAWYAEELYDDVLRNLTFWET